MRWIILAATASVLASCASADNSGGGELEGLPHYNNLKPRLESPDEFWQRRQQGEELEPGSCGKVKSVRTCSV